MIERLPPPRPFKDDFKKTNTVGVYRQPILVLSIQMLGAKPIVTYKNNNKK